MKFLQNLYYTPRRDIHPINLLLIECQDKFHYAWIKYYARMTNTQKSSAHIAAMGQEI